MEAQTKEAVVAEMLTVEEIKERFPDEWVILVDSDWVDMKTTKGVVAAHSPNRNVIHEIAKQMHLDGVRHLATFHTSTIIDRRAHR